MIVRRCWETNYLRGREFDGKQYGKNIEAIGMDTKQRESFPCFVVREFVLFKR